MVTLLLALIYLAFISLGLPDSLLGSAWPQMHLDLGAQLSMEGIISMLISCGTVISSLFSEKIIYKFGTGMISAVSTLLDFQFPETFICYASLRFLMDWEQEQ